MKRPSFEDNANLVPNGLELKEMKLLDESININDIKLTPYLGVNIYLYGYYTIASIKKTKDLVKIKILLSISDVKNERIWAKRQNTSGS